MNDREFAIAEAHNNNEAAQSVPVVGEAVAEAYVYEDVDGDDILGLRLLKEDYPMQHGEKLYIEPTTSITHAELDAKDARIRELEAAALDVCMAGSYESARLAVIQLNTVLRRPAKEHQS